MRKMVSAWFLLLLSTAQWIGGHVCFEVIHMIEVERKMTAAEEMLAELVTEEVGVKSSVQILKKEDLARRGNHYGDFVFFKEILEGKIYYTIESESETVKYITVARVPKSDNPDATHHTDLLKKLFNEFMMAAPELPSISIAKPSTDAFCFAFPHSFLFTPSLLHPPQSA